MRLIKPVVVLRYIVLFVAFSNMCYAGGLSAWEDATPYGNKLYYDGGSERLVEFTLKEKEVWFKEFYFYKNYTVAKGDAAFYIIDEKKDKIEVFHNKQDFEKALKERELNPFFIVRWYDDNYGSDKFWIPFSLVLFPFPFLMPILWLICLISLFRQSDKMVFLKKTIVFGYPVIGVLVLIVYNVPQSF